MNAMSSPAQSEFYAGVSPVEAPAVCPADLKNDRSPNGRGPPRRRALRTLSSLPIAVCIGVAATLAWQSYGDAAREMIANAHPQLGWLAPQGGPVTQNAPDAVAVATPTAPAFDQQQFHAIAIDLEAMHQGIDRIAPGIVAGQEQIARSIDRIAATQEQMARTVDQLTASQEQVMREITKLQAVEQYILYKSSEPPPRPAPAPARNPAPRPSLVPIVR
jgi:methyl-accepting chemotaxis protein